MYYALLDLEIVTNRSENTTNANEKPGVSAEVRERIVREESKRQSRGLLEQLIEKAFSDDEQIDERGA